MSVLDKVLPGQPLLPAAALKLRLPGESLGQPLAGTATPQFRQQLDDSLRTSGGIKFSAHALRRLESRGISLASTDVASLEEAVGIAAAKGARDSLVVNGRYALLVNVPSRTVVTAFDQSNLSDNVVTNIDSAVFVE
jgi:flagellar operon protein